MTSKPLSLLGEWTLDFDGQTVPITLPGDVHSALLTAGLIPDPYFASNEDSVRWVMEREWVIWREFDLDQPLETLELERVDTLCDLWLNGSQVGRCENAFRRWRFDVRQACKPGRNRIELRFDNPVAAAKALNDAQDFFVPWHWNVNLPHANLIRMVACDAGWDWNICLTPMGVAGDITLRPAQVLTLDYLHVDQVHADKRVHLSFKVSGDLGDSAGLTSVAGTITIDGQRLALDIQPDGLDAFMATAACTLDQPRLWWPNGMGDQDLYTVVVELDGQRLERNIGLRTIDIDQRKDEVGNGSAMQFVVNGRPLFAKGANWIPADALPSRRTPQAVRGLLESATQANMNMLRVWGGGLYEPDWFYDQCAELGLLIWQDAMFSCHLYPSNQAFLDNVAQELKHNVRRLQHSPAIALWCGDNEVIGALTWYPESQQNRDRYLVGYDRLNRTVEQAIQAHDPSRVFWPSSPCNGTLDFGDAWHDDASGDMHFWDVWHEAKPFSDYHRVKPRFCSEFGFQSFPSLETVKRFAQPKHWNVSSPSFDKHQRNPGGNARIMETLVRYFRFPKDFESTLYLSQLAQGLAFKTAVEYWRANSPHCAGALYWQLNDCWPVTSWATIEYGGRWKLSHYMARNFFAPVLTVAIPGADSAATWEVRVVSDNSLLSQVRIRARQFDCAGNPLATTWMQQHRDVPRLQATSFGTYALTQAKADFVEFQAYCRADEAHQQPIGQPQWVSRAHAKQFDFEEPQIAVEVQGNQVILIAKALAPYVFLQSETAGQFSDGGFFLAPNEPKIVTFNGGPDVAKSLRVQSLRDSY